MLPFKFFLSEARQSQKSFHVEMHLHETEDPIVKLVRGRGIMSEKQYHKNEAEHLGGKLFKILGKFKPTSLNHDVITHEFHKHLHDHGFYSHAPTHPMVMSPREQAFKSEFKHLTTRSGLVGHEIPHHDGGRGQGSSTMGRHVAIWSTRGPTHIFTNDNKRIKTATKAGHTTVFNDEKVKHAASGVKNRWFLRAGEIRQIPTSGLQGPVKGHGVKQYGKDFASYVMHKKPHVSRLHRDVLDWHKRNQKHKIGTPEHAEHQQKLGWIAENYPEMHPDKIRAHKSRNQTAA